MCVALFTNTKKYVKIRYMSEIKTLTKAWAKKIGRQEALGRLVTNGISPAAAEKLCDGRYPSEPKALLRRAILEVITKDGFALKEGA
jgi:hypothetical protein